MRLNRAIAYLFGCVALASSLLAYLDYVYMLGFPDGFVTELGRAERRLAYAFIGVSVVLAACFIYLGASASRKAVGRKLFAAVVLYLMSVAGAFLIDYYCRSRLDNGAGG